MSRMETREGRKKTEEKYYKKKTRNGDREDVRMAGDEVAELGDALAADETHLGRRLRPVAQQAPNRHLNCSLVCQLVG